MLLAATIFCLMVVVFEFFALNWFSVAAILSLLLCFGWFRFSRSFCSQNLSSDPIGIFEMASIVADCFRIELSRDHLTHNLDICFLSNLAFAFYIATYFDGEYYGWFDDSSSSSSFMVRFELIWFDGEAPYFGQSVFLEERHVAVDVSNGFLGVLFGLRQQSSLPLFAIRRVFLVSISFWPSGFLTFWLLTVFWSVTFSIFWMQCWFELHSHVSTSFRRHVTCHIYLLRVFPRSYFDDYYPYLSPTSESDIDSAVPMTSHLTVSYIWVLDFGLIFASLVFWAFFGLNQWWCSHYLHFGWYL